MACFGATLALLFSYSCFVNSGDAMAQIVVIEDEPVLRLTFRHILESAGHCVWDAGNGRDGIAQCREHRPDLVITDVIMPELSGNEAVAILQEEFPNMPVIAMSGLPVRTDQCIGGCPLAMAGPIWRGSRWAIYLFLVRGSAELPGDQCRPHPA